jgi:hypothetical protein
MSSWGVEDSRLTKQMIVVPSPLRYDLDFSTATDDASGTVTRSVTVDGKPIVVQSHYYIGSRRIEMAFGLSLTARLIDLIDLARAVYVADRISPRRGWGKYDPYGLQWRRHFAIRLPVREPELWSRPTLYRSLCALLEYFTDDCWSFEFVQRSNSSCREEQQGFLFSMQPKE